MEWTELKISVDTRYTQAVSDIACMTVPYGIYTEDYSELEKEAREIAHIDLIDEELLKKDRTKSVIHIYIDENENPSEALSFIREKLNELGIPFDAEMDGCREEDWANNWKAFFKPLKIGQRLFVRPIWEDNFDSEGRAVLNIEPGAAFGTGAHDTTRLCLETLDETVKQGDTVLDIGCGSGILAISSLLLGAKSAFGVDIDPLAVKTAKENGRLNNFDEPQLQFVCGDLADKVTGKYSVVVANIVADVIMMFASQVGEFMNPDSLFIASGIIDSRADEVARSLEENSLKILKRKENGGWVCFVCGLN